MYFLTIIYGSYDIGIQFESVMSIKDRYKELILGVFHYKTFAKSLENNFNTSDFSLLQINSCINELDELINVADSEIRSLSEKANVNASFFSSDIARLLNNAKTDLLLKKDKKLDLIRIKTNRQHLLFDIFIAVFSAFGIASSIISIATADSTGKIISTISMSLYLLVIISGYIKNFDRN